jgi:DNA polymerase-1
MRIMADESQDPVMIKLFHDGADIHTATAAWMYGIDPQEVATIQRYAAKRIGFGVITGITEEGLYDQMQLAGATDWTKDRCLEGIRDYFKIYRGVDSYMEACRAEARRYGFVRDRWGRIRYLPGVHSAIPRIRAEAERQSHSHKIQGGAQGLIKTAQAAIWRELRSYWRNGVQRIEPLLQVHDELLFELYDNPIHCHYWDRLIVRCLCETTRLRVPVKAKGKVGATWADAKD